MVQVAEPVVQAVLLLEKVVDSVHTSVGLSALVVWARSCVLLFLRQPAIPVC